MKLIIDIPEAVVTAIQNGEDYRYDIHTAIAQGTPYAERPQGELANEVWKLYKKHQSHLATYVYEFGIELQELLGRYGGRE